MMLHWMTVPKYLIFAARTKDLLAFEYSLHAAAGAGT